MKYAAWGLGAFLIAKLAFKQTAKDSLTYGLGALAVVSLLTAHADNCQTMAATSDTATT